MTINDLTMKIMAYDLGVDVYDGDPSRSNFVGSIYRSGNGNYNAYATATDVDSCLVQRDVTLTRGLEVIVGTINTHNYLATC
jgi:hypothetical protein